MEVETILFVETCALSVLLAGTEEEKLRLCFDAFDVDGNGFLTEKEVKNLTNTVKASIKSSTKFLKRWKFFIFNMRFGGICWA